MGQERSGSKHRGSVRHWLTVGVVVALLAAIAIQASRARAELANIQRLSLGMLIGTCVLQFVSQMLLNGALLLPLRTCMKALGFWELYVVRTGGLFVGGLVPVAGGLA